MTQEPISFEVFSLTRNYHPINEVQLAFELLLTTKSPIAEKQTGNKKSVDE